jgi:hypothetical protein
MRMTLQVGRAADITYTQKEHQLPHLGLTLKNTIWKSIRD